MASFRSLKTRTLQLDFLETRAVFSVTTAPDAFPPPPPGSGPVAATVETDPQMVPAATAAATADQTFLLHSRPSATKVIYLDFTGHTTVNTAWNQYTSLSSIVTPPYNFEGSPTTFSTNERARIQAIWARVSEDFAPFDVDVTTEDPGAQNLLDSGGGDTHWGVRVCIGGSYGDWFKQPAGGVTLTRFEYYGDGVNDCPNFVFANTQYNRVDYITLAVSHEVGHSLGLSHDGTGTNLNSYYGGQGRWAPIMGAGYDRPVTQWNNGDYANADNHEDDLAIITTQNGFGYRPDDYGDTIAAAGNITLTTPTTFSANGVIERNTDMDVLKLQPGFGPLSITINPYLPDPNLDIKAELLDSTGAVIATSDPSNSMAAKITATISSTNPFYLRISGVGSGNPLTTGYSKYGSIGQYFVTGTMAQYVPPNPLRVTALTATESVTGLVTGARVSFNYPVDRKTLIAANIKITGPAGGAVALTGVRPVPGSLTDVDLLFTPQKITGTGGVRVALSPNIQSLARIKLDTDEDNTTGELDDFYAADVFKFDSTPLTPAPIDDGATTDFPLVVNRAFNIRDLNVRVNLKHPAVGELEIDLVSPNNTVIRLFNHRGGLGDNLTDTRFDEQSTKLLSPPSAAPFKAVFKPDFDTLTLASLNGTSSIGTWKLRVIDNSTGMTGVLNSWGLTFTTDDARQSLSVVAVTPINDAASTFANLYRSFTVEFGSSMNPATVTTADFKVFNPKNAAVGVLSVKPVAGDPTKFLVTTAVWTKAGAYTIKIGPNVADTLGDSFDVNSNGFYLEAADTAVFVKVVDKNVYQSSPVAANIPDGKNSLISSIVIPDAISIGQLAITVNVQHTNLADLRLTLISPTGATFLLANDGTLTGDNLTNMTFTDEAARSITAGSGPYRGDYQPASPLSSLLATTAKGTWKLKIEDVSLNGVGQPSKLLNWQIDVRPGP
ncbi:proprotein convertase P-domain-containing protein [Zavarzinella formosa]|uniref:proprotein convertase P-domain-containing protein n=1 Tax=Zavarzinella formosa TaxID=360055 RepID=UPI0002F47B1C|nr:proprotein convertase P-domain-containing protein [Zavarzinella formosa]